MKKFQTLKKEADPHGGVITGFYLPSLDTNRVTELWQFNMGAMTSAQLNPVMEQKIFLRASRASG